MSRRSNDTYTTAAKVRPSIHDFSLGLICVWLCVRFAYPHTHILSYHLHKVLGLS